MTPEQATSRLIAEAGRYLNVRENPPGSNRGVEVDYWIKECKLDPKGAFPWCAAFVGAIGRQALGDALWPVPRTASVPEIAAWADKNGILMAFLSAPVSPGDLFVVWHPELKGYHHVGLVTAVHAAPTGLTLETIEGNTSGAGIRDGWGVFARSRTPGKDDRFVPWVRKLQA